MLGVEMGVGMDMGLRVGFCLSNLNPDCCSVMYLPSW
jgi:hypothetical protein